MSAQGSLPRMLLSLLLLALGLSPLAASDGNDRKVAEVLAPEEAGEKPYALLFDTMRESGYVALAEFAMRRRQHAVVIRPGHTGVIAHTLYYADEIRKADEYRADTTLVTKKERELALTLIQSMAAKFEPEKLKDTYREKLKELIAAKVAGDEVAPAPAAEERERVGQHARQGLQVPGEPRPEEERRVGGPVQAQLVLQQVLQRQPGQHVGLRQCVLTASLFRLVDVGDPRRDLACSQRVQRVRHRAPPGAVAPRHVPALVAGAVRYPPDRPNRAVPVQEIVL